MIILLVILICTVAAPASASPVDCIEAVESAVSHFLFVGAAKGSIDCSNDLVSHSLWAAAKQYCDNDEILKGSAVLKADCLKSHSQLTPYPEVLPQLTDSFLNGLPTVDFDDIGEHKVWNTSVLISRQLYDIAKRTNTVSAKQEKLHKVYGWALYGFWGGILLIGMLHRVSTFIADIRASRQRIDIETDYPGQPRRLKDIPVLASMCHWIKTNVIIPGAFNTYHRRPFWYFRIPTRLETIVVLAYWSLSVIIAAVSYDVFYPNLENTKPYQVWGYLADRLGNLCLANLPFLWLFGGRNNIFQWATGWKYETFNVFHRNIARAVVIQAILHAVANTVGKKHDGTYSTLFDQTWSRMGIVAVTSMSILVFSSSIYFRKHYYEAFLLIHKILAILVIIALFFHVSTFHGQYNGYLWPLVAMWSFERSLRFIRLAYYNIHVGCSAKATVATSTATYWKNMDVIKVELILGRRLSRPQPGHHYFLYQPLRWRGWENHPFTLGTWAPIGDSGISEKSTSSQSASSQVSIDFNERQGENRLNNMEDIIKRENVDTHMIHSKRGEGESRRYYKLIFWIRPFSGWTKSLRDACLRNHGLPVSIKFLLEGPYGRSHSIHNYDNVLYITGGTGISAAACYLTDHVYRSNQTPPTTRTKNITLLWSAKQAELIRHVATHELAPVLKRNDIRTSFFATSSQEDVTQSDFLIAAHKPNLTEYIRRYVQGISLESVPGTKTAILACGPASMADEVRASVHGLLSEEIRSLYYFEEAYGW